MRNSKSIWHSFIFPILGYFRRRRGKFLLRQFPGINQMRICDIGGSQHFWEKLDIGVPRSHITIYNISDAETQTADGLMRGEQCKLIIYDGHHVPVENQAFDLCVCNSVIEHVPPERREELAREIRRIAARIFLQTPAFEFPLEPHFIFPFLHWLPRSLGYWLAAVSPWRLLAQANRRELYEYYFGTRLLRRKELLKLFPDCLVVSERFCGLTKSHYVLRGAIGMAVEQNGTQWVRAANVQDAAL